MKPPFWYLKFDPNQLILSHDGKLLADKCTRLIAWRAKEKFSVGSTNDKLLDSLNPIGEDFLALLLQLAIYDPYFFALAKRMAVRTLVVHLLRPMDIIERKIAGDLLSMQEPQTKAPEAARDFLIVIAVAGLQSCGFNPLENITREDKGISAKGGCRILAEQLQKEFGCYVVQKKTAQSAWENRRAKLKKLGVREENVDEFLLRTKSVSQI